MTRIRLGLIIPKPNDGTSWYRAAGPLRHLSRHWPQLELVPMPPDREPAWSDFFNIDALFIQRPNTTHGLAWVQEAARVRCPVWLDYDDHSAAHQPNHPAFWAFHGENRTVLYSIIYQAAVVSVSTPAIADWVRSVAPHVRVVVIPNAVDETLSDPAPSRGLDPLKRLWRGSWSHSEDVYVMRDEMTQPDVTMHYIGYIPPWCRAGHDIISPWTAVTLYLETLRATEAGVCLVPLLDNTFNRAKSNCVWLEATWAGLATAHATDTGPMLPEFDKPGMLNLGDLRGATPESLAEARDLSLSHILDHLTLESVNPLRRELLEGLV